MKTKKDIYTDIKTCCDALEGLEKALDYYNDITAYESYRKAQKVILDDIEALSKELEQI